MSGNVNLSPPEHLTGIGRSFFHRLTAQLLGKLHQWSIDSMPDIWNKWVEKKIVMAGSSYKWGRDGFMLFWFFVVLSVSFISFVYLAGHPFPLPQKIMFFFCALICGAYLPVFLLNRTIAERRQQMMLELPDILDLLCVSVQAGLSFDGALGQITQKMKGLLVSECARMLQEMRFGISRRQALERLADRCGVQDISLFVSAVIQSEQLGVSLGEVLQVQADNLRHRRLQQAKAKAQKAPVKMVFPMAIFIFPTLFIVILLPIAFSLLNSFGSVPK
jgi:tight adherence protein C